MTSDHLIAMHKACERVIEDVASLPTQVVIDDEWEHSDSIQAQVDTLRSSVTSLATVQRDLLKAMLGQ